MKFAPGLNQTACLSVRGSRRRCLQALVDRKNDPERVGPVGEDQHRSKEPTPIPGTKITSTPNAPAMDDTTNTAQVIIRPPLAWGLAVMAGLALNWLLPVPFLPVDLPAGWLGAIVFVLSLALVAWAIVTITRAGSNVPTNLPTTAIVESGPYRFTRNPIYLGMFLGLIGLAIAFDNLWLLMMLVPFALVIHYGVVAREEAYLERKFGDAYRGYRSRVRRWL
jgi:protein-S-isoprenylcysteine O-methyltransferase Ste14